MTDRSETPKPTTTQHQAQQDRDAKVAALVAAALSAGDVSAALAALSINPAADAA